MPADLTITLAGTPTPVYLGEHTGLAHLYSAAAEASANSAETAAQAALAAANYHTTVAAGVAASAVDDLFASDESGSLIYYRKTGSSPYYVAIDPGFLTKGSGGQWKADGYNTFKNSNFGYGPSYHALVLGNGANQTIALNYDPINVTDGGGFGGDGREVVLRNGTNFITPNAGATAWLNPMSFVDGDAVFGGHVLPFTDNTKNLGSAAKRMATIYAGTGAINTSDERAKRDIGAIPDEWLDAWGDVEWCRFKFIDGSRWHLGLVAQHVYAAFEARGLDAFEIGLCCFDAWEEQVECRETGETRVVQQAGDRWGLRYDECQAIEAAWQRREMALLNARLAALESAQ